VPYFHLITTEYILFLEILMSIPFLVWVLPINRIVNQKREFILMRFIWMMLISVTIILYANSPTAIYVANVNQPGDGTLDRPYGTVAVALMNAKPGDVIYVKAGVYSEAIVINKSGEPDKPLVIKAYDPKNRPVFSSPMSLLNITDDNIVVDGLILDAQFAASDIVRIQGVSNVTIRNCEIRNGRKDGIDMELSDNVTIENCQIHHCLAGSFTNQQDAHGIVSVTSRNITIRGCEIFYVSGDCFQTDPSRGTPEWDNVLIEDCKLWTGPLPGDAADWHAGEVPGENAIDTKVNGGAAGSYRAKLTIRNTEAYGFMPGFINNRAAFNIKEKVDCLLENVIVHDNEIAYRLRGPGSNGGARVTIINNIAYDNVKTFRTEDGLEQLKIYNSTFDIGTGDRYFQNAGGGYLQSGLEVRNCLFFGSKPSEGEHSSNLSASSGFFRDRDNRDYHLVSGAPAIDAGVTISLVTTDIEGNPRVGVYDVGAYEFNLSTGIDDIRENPMGFRLEQNYPNPFNPKTTIAFSLPVAGKITLEIFDVLGRKVRTLLQEYLQPGQYQADWDGRNEYGQPLSSGIYIYQLRTGNYLQTRSMHLIQ
jgi:parallel beta-helix repeat protein